MLICVACNCEIIDESSQDSISFSTLSSLVIETNILITDEGLAVLSVVPIYFTVSNILIASIQNGKYFTLQQEMVWL